MPGEAPIPNMQRPDKGRNRIRIDMLEALRRSVGSWVVKAFIGVIMLSFAVWGVSDVFRGYRGNEVARVGETEIPAETYRNALQREIQTVSQQIGSYLTLDQARSFGLDRRVLGRLVAEAALDDEARRRGLGMSDSAVAASIRNDPTFRGPGGQFDRSYFNQFLRSTGYSEGMFVAEQRRRLLRNAIGEAVGGAPAAPEVLAAAVDRYRNETRSAEYILVTADLLDELPTPSEAELATFFEENRTDFRAPEYRRLALIPIEPEDIVDQIPVSDEDARAAFEARAHQFEQPERRTVEQITFADIEEARQARADIAEGRDFEEIAAERGLSQADMRLGSLTRDEIVDQAVSAAAFELEVGEVSEPVEGVFSPVLLRVAEVEAGGGSEFEQVADRVRRELAEDRARGEIHDLYDLIEDDRAAGLTLSEIAQRRSLPYREIEAVDRQGRDMEGESVAGLPPARELVEEAFQTNVGFEADPLQLGADGYVWFDVLDTVPARDRAFDEVRDEVLAAWQEEQIRRQVGARAEELAEQLRGGVDFEEAAEGMGAEYRTVGPLRRGDTSGSFGRAATGRLFTTADGGIAVAEAADSLQRVIFRVTDVEVPTYTPRDDDPYAREIVAGITDDLIGQYVTQLQDQLGVAINQRALRAVFGETDEF